MKVFHLYGAKVKREYFISQNLEEKEKNGQRETIQRPIKPHKAHLFG